MTYILVFLSFIALIVIHEIGHFLAAKKFGVEVEEFGLFFPPRLFGKKIGETIYSINLIPLGAFVKIRGENEKPKEDEQQEEKNKRSFGSKPIWQRAVILFAGVFSFWAVAFLIFSFIFTLGVNQSISDDMSGFNNPKVQIGMIAPNSPAVESGIRVGDSIKEISYQEEKVEIDKISEVQSFISGHKGKEISLTIGRGSKILELNVIPRVSAPENEGALGVVLVRTAIVKYPLWKAPIYGAEATFNMTVSIVKGWTQAIFNLIKKQPTGVEMVGPVGVISMMNQASELGASYFLQFVAMISVYFALFNLLPIPSVDGGRLLFLLIEKIRGKPANEKLEQTLTAIFFFSMILLFLLVTIKDIKSMF